MRPIHYAALALAAVLLLCALWAVLGPEPAAATLAAGGAIAASRVRRQRLAEAIAVEPEPVADPGDGLADAVADARAEADKLPLDELIRRAREAGRE